MNEVYAALLSAVKSRRLGDNIYIRSDIGMHELTTISQRETASGQVLWNLVFSSHRIDDTRMYYVIVEGKEGRPVETEVKVLGFTVSKVLPRHIPDYTKETSAPPSPWEVEEPIPDRAQEILDLVYVQSIAAMVSTIQSEDDHQRFERNAQKYNQTTSEWIAERAMKQAIAASGLYQHVMINKCKAPDEN